MSSQEQKVLADRARRSDRIEMAVPVEVMGTDYYRGQPFCLKGQTVVVSRHGAAVAVNYALATDQEVTLLCMDTGKEVASRVVGLIPRPEKDLVYGIAFLNDLANPWGIEFPTLTGIDEGFGRILLECRSCQNSSVFHLNEIEVQVFETSESIHKLCKHCAATTAWKKATNQTLRRIPEPKGTPASTPVRQAARIVNKRKHGRIQTDVAACIRESGFSEEVGRCENLSRGGALLRTAKPYQKRAQIEVALPYSIGGPNIFVPAQVVRSEDCGSFFKVAVAYTGASRKQRPSVYSGAVDTTTL